MKAKVARFYGWSDSVINTMPMTIFHDYWLMITPLEAQETLLNMKISAYPEMKKESQRKFFNEMRRLTSKYVDKTGGKVKTYKEVMSSIAARMMNSGR